MKNKIRSYVNKKFFVYPKTNEIIELREELYSMMCDKYDDCSTQGLSPEISYKQTTEMMKDYKSAIREVETGSSLSALKKKLVSSLAFSAVYFIALTCVYLYVSMVTLGSFEKSWLIGVGGAFVYLIYFASNMFGYAKIFEMPKFSRVSLFGLFLSLVPALYVFPSLMLMELYAKDVWSHSWLLVPVIVLLYIIIDLIIFGKKSNKLLLNFELIFAGFVLITVVYLFSAYIYDLWNLVWIVYVLYLAIVALVFYIVEKTKSRGK
jgi:hypothetical protein